MNSETQELRDHLDVVQLVSRYAHAVDRHDWGAFETIVDDDIHVEVPHVPSAPAVTRDEFVRMVIDTSSGFEATHHPITNHVVTLDGDAARCTCYAQAYHTIPTERGVADYCIVRGFYDMGFTRTADGWRINRMKIEFHGPVEGYMGVYDIARRRAKELASEASGD